MQRFRCSTLSVVGVVYGSLATTIVGLLSIAKLPLAKEVEEFVFKGTPINAELVKDLAGGSFLAHQRNVVLIGGTGSGKSHLAIGIARRLHPRRRQGALLQYRRPGQQA